MRTRKLNILFNIICFTTIALQSCIAQRSNPSMEAVLFEEDKSVIPLEERSRRKFDNAVIADLDQDGYLDLLLTEHARRVEIFWNNKGVFSKGKPFVFGDTHGITVVDYNADGLLEILVQPGGGGGKNPRRIRSFTIYKNRTISEETEFTHFKGTRGRAVKFVDTNKDGKLDLITTAFAPKNALEEANHFYKASNDDALNFEYTKRLPHADRFSTRALITDFNNDGIDDLIFFGGQNIIAVQGKSNFEFEDVTEKVLGNLKNIDLVNSITEIDFDNDGDFDLFMTRSKKPFGYESDYDVNTKAFYFFARTKPFDYELKIEGDFKLENLQMAFPDFDVYIGKKKHLFKRTKDRHGHHDFNLTQKEAEGWPEDTSKNGMYIGYLGGDVWRIAGYTKSPTTAVIHNVKEKPKLINLKQLPTKLLENRDGIFFDVTEDYGINITEQTHGTIAGDFNNDGWSDILVIRYGNSASQIEQYLYINHQGKQFVKTEGHGIMRKELGATGMGADAFDYDKDGDLDVIYANERGRWHLYTNNTKSNNNFIDINIGNSPSGEATSMRAVLTIEACGNIYKRVVGTTSASYSQSYNTLLHIGLGKCTNIENAKITWSNNEMKTLKNLKLNAINTP